ncbi:MAG: glycosyltransferase family 2 protein [Clostridia bacterium]|nr:glycosyltransferase family 2 protein [Clostridia bacterium]
MKNNNNKISIIVPIYKVEQYLNKCVESLINQTYKNLEIILVDDGSPDNCPKMCDEWAKKDTRVKVIHKKNGGVMSAWTTGFKNSSGNYIAFADPDDYVELNLIEKTIQKIEKHSADMAMFGYEQIYQNKSVAQNAYNYLTYSPVLEGENLEEFKLTTCKQINSYTPLYKWNKIFKRKLIEDNLKYCDDRVSLGDDCCIALGAILDSKKIVVLEDKFYKYIQRQNSIIHNYNSTLQNQMEVLLKNLCLLLKDKNYYNESVECFEISRMLFILTRNIINSNLNKKDKKQTFKNFTKSELVQKINILKKYIKNLPTTYKIFDKVFLTKWFWLNNFFIKTFNFIKSKKLK